MYKKIFALMSLMVIASMALAACGGAAATEAPAEAPAATEAPAEAPAATEAPVEPKAVHQLVTDAGAVIELSCLPKPPVNLRFPVDFDPAIEVFGQQYDPSAVTITEYPVSAMPVQIRFQQEYSDYIEQVELEIHDGFDGEDAAGAARLYVTNGPGAPSQINNQLKLNNEWLEGKPITINSACGKDNDEAIVMWPAPSTDSSDEEHVVSWFVIQVSKEVAVSFVFPEPVVEQ